MAEQGVAPSNSHVFLKSLKVGDNFAGVYYLESAVVRKTQQGKDFTDVVLRDKSGSVGAKMWELAKGVDKEQYVYVEGYVQDYMGKPSFILNVLDPAKPPVDTANYISEYADLAEIRKRFDETIAGYIKNAPPTLAAIVGDVFSNAPKDKVAAAPASTMSHYGCKGGLMAQTLRILKMCGDLAADFGLSPDEEAVLCGAALLCRVGGLEAFEFRDCVPVISKKGHLLGVSNLSLNRVSVAVRRAAHAANGNTDGKWDADLALRLIHAVVSCEGHIKPQTKEAMILANAVRMDDEMVNAIDFIATDQNVDDVFTAFDPATERRYYKGQKTR